MNMFTHSMGYPCWTLAANFRKLEGTRTTSTPITHTHIYIYIYCIYYIIYIYIYIGKKYSLIMFDLQFLLNLLLYSRHFRHWDLRLPWGPWGLSARSKRHLIEMQSLKLIAQVVAPRKSNVDRTGLQKRLPIMLPMSIDHHRSS